MNAQHYCEAVSPDGLPCRRFVNHGDMHVGCGKYGQPVMWPVEPVCQACNGTGTLRYEAHPYGLGFGAQVESMPCPCRAVKP